MKFLFLILTGILSISAFAEDKVQVDVYIKRAGWTSLYGGYMDPATKLVWGAETGDKSWGEARAYCRSLKQGGVSGWRLPSVTELQKSVCQNVGYDTRIPCPEPRDHEKDLWVLNKAERKDVTYWAGDLIPGDPYNAYYFKLDVEGQHIVTSKNDKANARCVHASDGYAGAPLTLAENEEVKETTKRNRPPFYVQPMIGLGSYISNNISADRLLYLNGELRIGITSKSFSDSLYLVLTGEGGFDIGNKSYPSLVNITIGPEYFFFDNMSILAGLGVGILTQNIQVQFTPNTNLAIDTATGFSWKLALTWLTFTFGEKNKYSIPASFSYSGVATSIYPVSHVIMFSVGFRFLNID